jgi:hypothetical protein
MQSYNIFLSFANVFAKKWRQERISGSNSSFHLPFGRVNVERWRREGKITPYKRPGKLEYRTADLRLLQRQSQDYLSDKD